MEGVAAFSSWFFPDVDSWGNGRILITTRHNLYVGRTKIGYIARVNIIQLKADAALEMMLDNVNPENEKLLKESRKACAKLVSSDYFDGLPLAIATAKKENAL